MNNTALESARKAETEARTADKAAFLDKMARMSAQIESLKVQPLHLSRNMHKTPAGSTWLCALFPGGKSSTPKQEAGLAA